ncbi:MAG TPA: mucoidy inhibitor MuiA family protein, partial [Leptospiraceae bacterium]|nr:mucoidy inhibitor MuiA family protein [Leptospiraceae bacterium]
MRFHFLLFILIHSAVWADSVTKEGKLQEVILYRNQALVMRTLEVDLKDGIHEIIVSRLPSEIIQSSLYAESSGAEIRGTRMKTKELSEDPEAPVKELDEKIEKISSDISKVNRLLQVNQSKVLYLTKQEDFAAATEKQEMTKGVLNPDVIAKITLFHFDQKRELANEEFQLQADLKKLNKEKDHLQRQRKQLTKTTPRLLEASVFVEKTGQGTAQIKLFYLVQNAGWNPVYNIYSKSGEKNVTTEFNAKIQQFSGENWENVQITLSNATPALSAAAPSLSPFRLSLSSGPSGYVTGDLRAATQNAAKKMSIATQKQMGAQNWD